MDCTARCSLLGKYGSGRGTGDARSQRQSENKIGETLVLKNNVICKFGDLYQLLCASHAYILCMCIYM